MRKTGKNCFSHVRLQNHKKVQEELETLDPKWSRRRLHFQAKQKALCSSMFLFFEKTTRCFLFSHNGVITICLFTPTTTLSVVVVYF